jgi:subtilisin family serine protease
MAVQDDSAPEIRTQATAMDGDALISHQGFSDVSLAPQDQIPEAAVPNVITSATYAGQWHLYNPGGADINVLGAWNNYSGLGVKVGIVDQGVQYTHPELAANYDASIDYDVVLNNSDGSNKSTSEPHGTSVAGVVAAANDGVGTTGVAFNSTIASYRFLGSGSIDGIHSDLIDVIRRQADMGIDVSNNSWGWVYPLTGNFIFHAGVEDALEYGVSTGRGGLGTNYIFAAGNSRGSGDFVNYSELHSSRFSIAVGAVGPTGNVTGFSTPARRFWSPHQGSA